MKKFFLLTIIAGLLLLLIKGIFVFISSDLSTQKEVIYIAVVAPTSGKDKHEGDAMIKGISLYIDKINSQKTKGLENKEIKLLIFDDKNTKANALKVAYKINEDNKTVLVLGHYYNSTSLAAGDFYRQSGIPVITASATSEQVSTGNEWYFRTIPGDDLINNFMINYITKFQKQSEINIIFDKDEYSSFVKGFEEMSSNYGIKIKHKWSFDKGESEHHVSEELNKIIRELKVKDDIAPILCITRPEEGAKIITSIKFPDAKFVFMGHYSFSTPSFIDVLKDYPQEKIFHGYYSDNIYAISPFLFDLSSEKAFHFRKEYLKRYNEEPSWISACYYDAAQTAVEAIKRAEFESTENMRENRRKVKDSLSRFNSEENSIEGVTHNIFFDANGNSQSSIFLGYWQNHQFFAEYDQYQIFQETGYLKKKPRSFKQDIGDMVIKMDELTLIKTQIVYTGMYINKISKIDFINNTYLIDFYLWFSFSKDIDDKNILFYNAIQPIKLKDPIKIEVSEKNIITQTYRIKAEFNNNFTVLQNPLGEQMLKIQFHHKTKSINKLMYIPDKKQCMSRTGIKGINIPHGWTINDMDFYQDTININLMPDLPSIKVSSFNTTIWLDNKKNIINFSLKNFVVAFFMIIILHIVFFIPSSHFISRSIIIITILSITLIYDFMFLEDAIREFILVKYEMNVLYILSFITGVITLATWILKKKKGN
ncbi:MAG: ABC transporter substrate-binding protein [Desulfobacterales bacterium]|nr:ABC transporter substrate-binding protein [Desulfobacterales bacterium]